MRWGGIKHIILPTAPTITRPCQMLETLLTSHCITSFCFLHHTMSVFFCAEKLWVLLCSNILLILMLFYTLCCVVYNLFWKLWYLPIFKEVSIFIFRHFGKFGKFELTLFSIGILTLQSATSNIWPVKSIERYLQKYFKVLRRVRCAKAMF